MCRSHYQLLLLLALTLALLVVAAVVAVVVMVAVVTLTVCVRVCRSHYQRVHGKQLSLANTVHKMINDRELRSVPALATAAAAAAAAATTSKR